MQMAFFAIPARGDSGLQEELNPFLRSHCVLSVHREFVAVGENACWALAVEFLEGASPSASPPSQGRKPRVDYKEVLSPADFALFANLRLLRDQLLSQDVDVGHYHFFMVHDPKERLICAASFPERVLHHAIMNVCEPVLERYAIHDSYACRTGKGMHAAVTRAQQFTRRYRWYLKLDIRQYREHHRLRHEVRCIRLV